MVAEEVIWDKLKTVMDPELMINLVDLGLIYKVEVEEYEASEEWMPKGDRVRILMTLTSPACPLVAMFDELVGGPIRKIDGVGRCDIEITFEPLWHAGMMSEEAKMELGMW